MRWVVMYFDAEGYLLGCFKEVTCWVGWSIFLIVEAVILSFGLEDSVLVGSSGC